MRTLLSVTLAALLSASAVFAQDGKTIRIATEGAYPPFNFMAADGTLQGLDVDIAKALCAEMKANCAIVAQDWDGMIPALTAGKFDAIIASMSITEERKQKIDFTNRYYKTPLAIAVLKEGGPTGTAVAELEGKTIGAQAATIQANTAEDIYGKAGVEVKLYPTQEEAAADLENGRIDALMSDKFVITDWLNTTGKDCCKLLGDVAGTDTDVGIGLRKGDNVLKERFNTAIEAIVKNGTYKTIVAKYFPFDIY
ncbi:ABC transporter substrate-binding protein [Rhizobium sp. CFBP 8762]|uniref:ABC transporter substrate-binding protein n=1 Tax=Rhizobium sp. CFBP 8762 TaxID=2775279 RepID=UPI001782507E|nr:ABC transporter substrate-binding protein [Rhizobium sp. CFBP 8762]MBD8553570.1 ABC transporter substrate-binding protein [Rhizobium sp. CFBP 8762]